MRLAVLSDIHGNLTALETALADLQAQGGADVTWFLGDLAAFGPRPAECVQRVKALVDAVKDDEQKKGSIRVIHGNTDRHLVYGSRPTAAKPAKDADEFANLRRFWRDFGERFNWCTDQLGFDEYEFLAKLPGETDLKVDGYGYVIGYHGTPGDDEGAAITPTSSDEEAADALLDREGRLGIGGHIHVQMDRLVRGWRVVNVGSVGVPFDANAGKAEYGIFTFEGDDVQVDLRAIAYDFETVIADSEARGNPASDWLARTLRGTA
ncbi:MAG: metallophosphatase family protein [Anaerolineae bacterium]|nr:metallophosphatase family protein [Anaerolineae bacterium]